ncbi:glycoside hydrolase family 25 protein [Alsobacter sp. SYSU M60028]|uniref:Glycoside hydrolase family 25 protein n=1 Tax=Alsobacter ponti TaxID=2962936 RepID=A0ABT1LC05_9HYPH|nr:glycoside hydrolase family 25 protein [Alsobacter ponti]MCP8939025.1 glycoside hydrolase family 25 protein [Alsobacter ponti]
MAFFVRTPRPLQWIGLALAASLLASCTMAPNYYPRKSDSKPHPGVAKAQTYPIHGIDISRYQTNVNWAEVQDAGTKFVFIKATEGGDYLDPQFWSNWSGAKAAGIPRGAYHFVYWCRPADQQARWFAQHIPQDPDALPPVLDLEWNGHSLTCPRKVPKEQALAMIRVMLGELERHTGKKPIIYTDITFHEEVLKGEFEDYPFWIRSVAAEPHERYSDRRWTMWQWTTTGQVPGVRGAVDRNVFNGTEKEWVAWLKRARVIQDEPMEAEATASIRAYLPF